MGTVKRLQHIQSRLSGIAAFASTGFTTRDKLKMLVVGYARGHTLGSNGVLSWIGGLLFPEIAVRPALLGGLIVYLDPSDLSHLVVADEILVQRIYDLDLVPFTPDLILDCGAHIGLFTLLAASRFPESKLVAFEPEPENVEWLQRQIDSNNVRVNIVRGAVFIRDGEEVFGQSVSCAGALAACDGPHPRGILVKTIHLSRYIAKERPIRLLLKMDIEGAEDIVLPDVVNVLPVDSAIFFEAHGGDPAWSKLKSILEKNGFNVTRQRQRDRYVDGFAVRQSSP